MDRTTKIEAPAATRTSIGEIKVAPKIEIDGLDELRKLTEALSQFHEKGLTIKCVLKS